MTAQGSALSRLARAIATGNVFLIETTAAELPRVPLDLAVEITAVLAQRAPERYPRAAARLLGRICLERRGMTLELADAALELLHGLRDGEPHAQDQLHALARGGPLGSPPG